MDHSKKSREQLARELTERLKELKCHNQMSGILANPELSVDEVFSKTVNILPEAWQFPNLAVARIEVAGKFFESAGYVPTKCCQKEDILVAGKRVGEVMVGYRAQEGLDKDKPFLKEEHDLLAIIAERLGNYLERHAKDLALQKSEEQYRSILEASPDVITITDLKGRILLSSPKAFEMFGYESSYDFRGRTLLEYIDPADHDRAMDGIRNMFQGNFMGATEYVGLKADGTSFDVEVNGQFILDNEGKPVNMVFITRDITQRRNTEKILSRTEARFRKLVENINDAIYEVDNTGTVLYVSPSIERIVGYQPEDLIGKNFFGFMHPDDRPILAEALAKLGQKDFSFLEYRYYAKDGTLRWVRSSTKPILENGKMVGGIGSLTDITDRKHYEEELLKLSRAVEQSPVSIVITNLDGNIEYANPKAIETTGYTLNELVGKNPRVLKSGETGMQEYQSLWNTITSGENWHGIFHNKRKNGGLYWESSTISPITDANGTITHFLAVKEDITDRIHTQQTLVKSEAALNYAQEIANMGSWELNLKTNELTWSQNYYRLLGLEPDGKPLTADAFNKRVHPDDFHLLSEQQDEIIRTRLPASIELRIIMPDGSEKWIQDNVVPVFEGDELVILKGVNIDITDKKIRDKEIKKLSLAVEQSPVSIVITDLEANIEYVNPTFTLTTGYSMEEVLGRKTSILKSGMTDRALYDELWATLREGRDWKGEWINKRKNGELYWESISISPIHDEEGKVRNYLAIKQDISERKAAEQEIRDLNATLEQRIEERTTQLSAMNENLMQEIEERKQIEEALHARTTELENFFTVALDLLCIADTSGNFLRVNKAWENLLGYKTEDLENKQFLEFVHPDDLQATLDAMSQLKEQNPLLNFINRYRTKEGDYRFIEWRSVPVGNFIYAAARDITERKNAEEFENEMLQMSPQLTGIPFTEIDNALNLALSRIGLFLGIDRIYTFEMDFTCNTMTNTHEWCYDGIHSIKDRGQRASLDEIPRIMEILRKHENVVIPSVQNLPPEWKLEKEILESLGIISVLIIPILAENHLIGFVGLDSVSRPKLFNQAEKNILRVWSSMLASLINNQRSETLLEQTRQNYRTFFNTIDDFLFVLDSKGIIVDINQTAKVRLGWENGELIGQKYDSFYPKDRLDEVISEMKGMLAGKVELCTVPILTKTGDQIPVEAKVKRGHWNGQEVYFIVCKDISDIKLSEQKFSKAFQSSSAMMAISNFYNGEYIDINGAFLEVIGFTREEIIGQTNRSLKLFIDPDLRQRILDSLDAHLPVRKWEVLMRSKEGVAKTGLLSAESIYIGDTKCLLTVSIDITDRIKAEEDLRTARMEAEQANHAKSEFLSRMSHELRTPMNSILGFAQLLEMGELNAGQRKGVAHIMRSGKHLLDLINEVLDISRIEAGRLSLSLEPVHIDPIISEMIEDIQPQASERGIKIKMTSTPNTLLHVRADRQRLKQVLLNLLSNAVKYNREEGWIHIETERVSISSGADNIRISVSDSGSGIAASDLPKLFTPFERIGAEKTETEGTGLGLSVVKKLMEAMGGLMGVESEPGRGSTFWVEFPVIESQMEAARSTGHLVEPAAQQTGREGTILYIEDNTSNIDLVEQLIAVHRAGINLVTTMYGKQGVDMALKHNPDLILLDLNLPDLHGSEVLKLLLANEKTKSIPVVIISADAMHSQYQKLLKAGAKKYLTKPLDIVQLLEVIDEVMGG